MPLFPPTTALALLAATPLAGYALVNGTGTILGPWTAPNDSAMHRVFAVANINVGSSETGGAIGLTITSPDSTSHTPSIFAGGSAGGFQYFTVCYLVAPNTTVTLKQTSALTGGAAVLWAELWGS